MACGRANLALYLILFYVAYGCDLKLNSCDNDNYNALVSPIMQFTYLSFRNGRLEVEDQICVHRGIVNLALNRVSLSTGRRFSKKSMVYYRNSVATFNLLITAGDIERNPGPSDEATSEVRKSSQNKSSERHLGVPKCMQCDKAVKVNNKRLYCIYCFELTHVRCVSFENRLTQYENYWTCPNCSGKELPFYGVRDLDELDSVIPDSENECYIDSHWEKLSQHSKHLRLCHLNCQSLLSTFDEFVHLVSKYKLDILTLSETWLRNNFHQIAHIQIPGYSFAFKNRGEKRGDGVAVYLREELKYKERTDLMRLEPSVEHIWIEISGKNKNSNVLLGVFYQPDSDPVKKCAWVEKFETILAAVHSKWDGILAIAGDINIDITNPSSFAQKYQGILRSFNLNQHIKDPTRKGRWLIDHIATNIPNNVIATGVIPTPEVSDHDMPYIIVNARLIRS